MNPAMHADHKPQVRLYGITNCDQVRAARAWLTQHAAPLAVLVAIVGGTNIGKSVLFNHLAGEVASASSPLASRSGSCSAS